MGKKKKYEDRDRLRKERIKIVVVTIALFTLVSFAYATLTSQEQVKSFFEIHGLGSVIRMGSIILIFYGFGALIYSPFGKFTEDSLTLSYWCFLLSGVGLYIFVIFVQGLEGFLRQTKYLVFATGCLAMGLILGYVLKKLPDPLGIRRR